MVRFGTHNTGSTTGRAGEVNDTLFKHKVDICYVHGVSGKQLVMLGIEIRDTNFYNLINK